LLAAFTVVPGEEEGDRQADQEQQQRDLLDRVGPVKGVGRETYALQKASGGRGVGNAPLHDLTAAEFGPRAFSLTLCRHAGHSIDPSGLSLAVMRH
jgi:hypothetical protein